MHGQGKQATNGTLLFGLLLMFTYFFPSLRRPVVYLFHEDEKPDEASLEAMTEAARRLRSTELMFCTVNKQVWDGKRMGTSRSNGLLFLG